METAVATTTALPITMDQLTEQAIAQIILPIEVSEAITGPDVRAKHQAQVAELRKQYAGLTTEGPQDTEANDRIQKAITAVTKVATGIDKARKDVTAPWFEAKKAVDTYGSALEKQVRDEVLAPLQAQKDAVLKERDRLAKEAEELIRKRIDGRKQHLFDMGLTWNGRAFASHLPGVPEVSEAQVTGLNDGPFEELCGQVKDAVSKATEEAARAASALAEQARKDKEDREKQAAIAAENARKERELKEREEKINASLRESRKNALLAVGMVVGEDPRTLSVGDMWVAIMDLHIYDEEQMNAMLIEAKEKREKVTAQEQEQAAQREREAQERAAREEKERIAREERIAAEAAQRERDRIAQEAEQKRQAEVRAEEERKKAEAKLSDKKKHEAYIDHLLNVEVPAMKSEEGKHAIGRIKKFLMESRSAKL